MTTATKPRRVPEGVVMPFPHHRSLPHSGESLAEVTAWLPITQCLAASRHLRPGGRKKAGEPPKEGA